MGAAAVPLPMDLKLLCSVLQVSSAAMSVPNLERYAQYLKNAEGRPLINGSFARWVLLYTLRIADAKWSIVT